MAIDRKRSRLVSFRLSEQEYQILHNSTLTGGARSISDFARRALLDGNGRGSAEAQTEGGVTVNNNTLEQLVTTMGELNRVISRLSVLVETNSQDAFE
jgi:tRNA pseudouridine-54 N-methylase